MRCTLPLLGDAYGLYYNKDAFKAAGITAPPKTWSELAEDAKKLTKTKGDSYEQLGFMPNYHGYESTTEHYLGGWNPTYFDADGKSNIAKDPAFASDAHHAEEAGRRPGRLREAGEVPHLVR